jgi:hypothetical protein
VGAGVGKAWNGDLARVAALFGGGRVDGNGGGVRDGTVTSGKYVGQVCLFCLVKP